MRIYVLFLLQIKIFIQMESCKLNKEKEQMKKELIEMGFLEEHVNISVMFSNNNEEAADW